MAEILTIRPKTISNQSIKGVKSHLSQSENGGSLKTCDFNWFYHNFDYKFINTFYVLTALLKVFPYFRYFYASMTTNKKQNTREVIRFVKLFSS